MKSVYYFSEVESLTPLILRYSLVYCNHGMSLCRDWEYIIMFTSDIYNVQ